MMIPRVTLPNSNNWLYRNNSNNSGNDYFFLGGIAKMICNAVVNPQLKPLCILIGPAPPPPPTTTTPPPPPPAPNCPIAQSSDWTAFEQNCYKYFKMEKKKKSAENYCLNEEQVFTITVFS